MVGIKNLICMMVDFCVSKLTVEFGIFGLVFFLYVMMLEIKGTKKLNVKLNFFSIYFDYEFNVFLTKRIRLFYSICYIDILVYRSIKKI